jgi:hypothetical protein
VRADGADLTAAMIRKPVVAALALLAVAACAEQTHSLVVADDACVGYGFHVGTPQYRLCSEHEAVAPGSGRNLAGPGPVR